MTTHRTNPGDAFNQAVAEVLRGEKAAARLHNKDLAAMTGLSESSVRRYLAPEREISVGALNKLTAALGTTPGAVLIAATQRLKRPPSPEQQGDVSSA